MPRRRLASRILLVNQSRRLLLFKISYKTGARPGMSCSATPGGQLRDDESFEAAAMRELQEDTGTEVKSIGRCIARKEFPWRMPDGGHVLEVEHYYVAHVVGNRIFGPQGLARY